MLRHVHTPRVRADHYTSRYRPFADSYRPGPVGLQYSPREVCTSVARGMLTISLTLWPRKPSRDPPPALPILQLTTLRYLTRPRSLVKGSSPTGTMSNSELMVVWVEG